MIKLPTLSGVSFRHPALWLLVLFALALSLHGLPQLATADEFSAPPDPRIGAALDVLASSPTSGELRRVLDSNHVAYRFVPMAPGIFARYSVTLRTIDIDRRWSEEEPVTLAAVLAHEAVHVADAVSGYLSAGRASACLDSEIRAVHASARFWTETYGEAGKAVPIGELEQQLNLIADRQQHEPGRLEQLVRQTYADQCDR